MNILKGFDWKLGVVILLAITLAFGVAIPTWNKYTKKEEV